MSSAFEGLQPEILWKHFEAFTKVARPSGKEEAAVAYAEKWAKEMGFEVKKDKADNLCVHVPGTKGRENAPVVVLQGHVDMVCERNSDSPYDAMKGNLHVVREGEWITAEGTTLGADNAIGVAAGMAAAEDPGVAHGPLDLLMTMDEETGMSGAMGLDAGMIRGRILLNLDSEEDGVLTVGCAGGCDTRVRFPVSWVDAPGGTKAFRIAISGLLGGHSGLDIVKNRMNAVQTLARLLQGASSAANFHLSEIQGGSMRNAIPREASAVIHVQESEAKAFQEQLEKTAEEIRSQYKGIDEGLKVDFQPADGTGKVLPDEACLRLMGFLRAAPSGVIAMSQDIEGLVETSTNLGVLTTSADSIDTISCSRSSVAGALRSTLDILNNVALLAGATPQEHGGYPGWKPDLESKVLQVVRSAHADLFSKDAEVGAVHAGLECGLIGESVPGMDMISFGPDITGAHSPDERVSIPSTGRFWKLLCEVLDRLSK